MRDIEQEMYLEIIVSEEDVRASFSCRENGGTKVYYQNRGNDCYSFSNDYGMVSLNDKSKLRAFVVAITSEMEHKLTEWRIYSIKISNNQGGNSNYIITFMYNIKIHREYKEW